MIFNNSTILGYNHTNNFWGENSFAYSSTKTFSIDGYVLDLANDNGVNNVLRDWRIIQQEAKSFQNIILNNVNYGVGKVTSLSIEDGNWVKYTKYTADIEVLTEVPLQNILSKEFNGIDLTNKKLNLIKSFSESFNLDFDTQNKILGGEHSIDIQYNADNPNINLIRLAQVLATELLKTIPTNLAEGNYSTRTNYKVLNSEDYNVIDGRCGFRRTFEYSTENADKPYQLTRQISTEINSDGIVTVKESCEIQGVNDNPSLYDSALIGLKEQLPGSFDRCNEVFKVYKDKFNVLRNLNSHFINKDIKVNKFLGNITYDLDFTNDPTKENALYSWEKTQTLDRDEQGIWTAQEEGGIIGFGKTNTIEKYNNASTAWTTIKSQIFSRLNDFYQKEAKNKISGGTLKYSNSDSTKFRYNGKITYNYNYTDDPTVQASGDIKKITIEKNDTGLTEINRVFIVPNSSSGYPVLHKRGLKNQGTYTITIKMDIGCINGVFNGKNYLNNAKSLAGFSTRSSGNFLPTDPFDEYLETVSFSSDEIEKTVTYEEVYKYS